MMRTFNPAIYNLLQWYIAKSNIFSSTTSTVMSFAIEAGGILVSPPLSYRIAPEDKSCI